MHHFPFRPDSALSTPAAVGARTKMKCPRAFVACAFVCLGCTGDLVGSRPGDEPGGDPGAGSGHENGAHGGGGKTGSIGGGGVGMPDPGTCGAASVSRARVWRLTHTQYRN